MERYSNGFTERVNKSVALKAATETVKSLDKRSLRKVAVAELVISIAELYTGWLNQEFPSSSSEAKAASSPVEDW